MERFGKYILLEKLAAGGMAEVYLAKTVGASGIAKNLAVKRILPQYSENPEFIDMFKEEAKIAVNLNHGNVVSIFDFGMERKQFFLVMEYVEGQNLRQVLNHLKKETKSFSIDQIVYITKEVAAGLDHAHRCLDGNTARPLNITHRDMSPQNIMVSFEGEVKIVDFGIAKAESQMEQTRAGTIKGKFGYMSPEQADGQPIDLRTDIFSLGIVMWELLANERLFTSNSEAGTLKKVRECHIPSLRKINPSISPELERICNKALAKDKTLRYQTAAAFHRDLNRFLNTQYPEFSPHDFSVFMKSAFSQMFIENRKKLMEYAKVSMPEEKEAGTHTQTLTGSINEGSQEKISLLEEKLQSLQYRPIGLSQDAMSANDIQGFDSDAVSRKVSLDSLKLNNDAAVKRTPPKPVPTSTQSGIANSLNTNPNIRKNTVTRNTGIYYQQTQPKSNVAIPILLVIAIVGGAYVLRPDLFNKVAGRFISSNPKNTAALPNEVKKVEMASKQTYSVSINSSPTGARVFVNDQDTAQITPAVISVNASQSFKLSLRMPGYQDYEQIQIAQQNGQSLQATLLPKPRMGYLNVAALGAGSNTVVEINGQRIRESLPLSLYGVPANTPVTIVVRDPYTGRTATQKVSVGVDQKADVKFILEDVTKKKVR